MATTQQPPQAASEKTIISKMSPRKMGIKPVAEEKATPMCSIYGSCTGLKTGTDKTTDRIWVALQGSFEAVNYATGEIFRSGLLFLPSGIHETVETAVRQMIDAETKEELTVKFALELRTIKANNPAGYNWQAINLMPIQTTDELDALRQAIKDAQQARLQAAKPAMQLPSPAEAPKPESTKLHKAAK